MTDTPSLLTGKNVCVAGRFVAVPQREFRRYAEAVGCHVLGFPNANTDFLVIGDEGCDSSVKILQAAWKFRKAGRLQFVTESEFYHHAEDVRDTHIIRRLTLAEIAKVLDLPGATLRQWVRWDLLKPSEVIHRLERFSFQSIVAAKQIRTWTQQGFSTTRIRKALENFQHVAKPDSPLGEIVQQNGRLLVRHDGKLSDGNGQTYFDFGEQSKLVVNLATSQETATDLFERGLQAESQRKWRQAAGHYRRAIELEPHNPSLFFNLGNALYCQGQMQPAREAFQTAVTLDAGYAEAWNNLGNTLLELERWRDAIEAFSQALRLIQDYPEARYNLDLALGLLAEYQKTQIYPGQT